VLKGEPIEFLRNSNNSLPWLADSSLRQKVNPIGHTPYFFDNAVITGFFNDYSATTAQSFENLEEDKVMSRTFVNFDVLELYKTIYEDILKSQDANVIFSGRFSSKGKKYWMNYFLLDVQDTTSLTAEYLNK